MKTIDHKKLVAISDGLGIAIIVSAALYSAYHLSRIGIGLTREGIHVLKNSR